MASGPLNRRLRTLRRRDCCSGHLRMSAGRCYVPKKSAELLLELLCGPFMSRVADAAEIVRGFKGSDLSRRGRSQDACKRHQQDRSPKFQIDERSSNLFLSHFCLRLRGASEPASEPVTRSRTKITAPAPIPIDSSTKIGCKLTESLHTLGELVCLVCCREKDGEHCSKCSPPSSKSCQSWRPPPPARASWPTISSCNSSCRPWC